MFSNENCTFKKPFVIYSSHSGLILLKITGFATGSCIFFFSCCLMYNVPPILLKLSFFYPHYITTRQIYFYLPAELFYLSYNFLPTSWIFVKLLCIRKHQPRTVVRLSRFACSSKKLWRINLLMLKLLANVKQEINEWWLYLIFYKKYLRNVKYNKKRNSIFHCLLRTSNIKMDRTG